jgi:VIT1/CCC1 family predicted Fe2+/Mn2+ transporter
MPATPHVERHFKGSDAVRDIVIGMSDGLTVPFALAAGLSGAVGASRVVVTAGLAEIAAGSLAMGLGGFLAARTDAEHYASEEARERREVQDMPGEEAREIVEVLGRYGLTAKEVAPLVAGLKRRPGAWVDFMMRFELGLERPEPGRAVKSALTIAAAYIAGGLIPLAPYFVAATPRAGLPISVGVTLAALLAFGFVKGRF